MKFDFVVLNLYISKNVIQNDMKYKMGAIFFINFPFFYDHRFVIYDQGKNKSDTELKSYCIPLGLCRIG